MLFLVDSNHLVHLFWHMAATKSRNESGDSEALPEVADVLDWFLNRLDNLRGYLMQKHSGGDIRFLAVFDSTKRPSRCGLMPEYKANRTRIAGIAEAVADAKRAVECSDEWELWIAPDGHEADDVMASIAYQSDDRVLIHSPDKDLNQCLEPGRVAICKRSAMVELGENANGIPLGSDVVMEPYKAADYQAEFKFRIDQWVDYQCMVGDSADNLKGARWVGPKKAQEILRADKFPLDCDDLLNARQLAGWADFLERLTVLREVFTLRADLNLKECDCGN